MVRTYIALYDCMFIGIHKSTARFAFANEVIFLDFALTPCRVHPLRVQYIIVVFSTLESLFVKRGNEMDDVWCELVTFSERSSFLK